MRTLRQVLLRENGLGNFSGFQTIGAGKMLDSLTATTTSDVEVHSAEPERSPAKRSGGGAQLIAA
jgi:hypothetical protein